MRFAFVKKKRLRSLRGSPGNPSARGVGVLVYGKDPRLTGTGWLLNASPFSSLHPKARVIPGCVAGWSSRAAVGSVTPENQTSAAPKLLKRSVSSSFLPLSVISAARRFSSAFLAAADPAGRRSDGRSASAAVSWGGRTSRRGLACFVLGSSWGFVESALA